MENNKNKLYYNGKILDADTEVRAFQTVYEVIRIKNGRPVFFHEHLERLRQSWYLSDRLKHRVYPDATHIAGIVEEIIKINGIKNQNVRIDLDINDLIVRPMPSYYPVDHCYAAGVDTVSMKYLRPTPNAKISNSLLYERANELMRIENVFEILLVNDENQILEGSRSNVFFVKDNDVFTTPTENVLSGVTRNAALKIFESMPNVVVHYDAVSLDDVYMYDCCFLTGTSIDLLPVRRIDSQILDSANNMHYMQALRLYRQLIG